MAADDVIGKAPAPPRQKDPPGDLPRGVTQPRPPFPDQSLSFTLPVLDCNSCGNEFLGCQSRLCGNGSVLLTHV